MGTIWFDEEPYPGPDSEPTLRDLREYWEAQYVLVAKAFSGVAQAVSEYGTALHRALMVSTHDSPGVYDMNSPHIPAEPKINPTPHGPPVKRQWDRKGRRTC